MVGGYDNVYVCVLQGIENFAWNIRVLQGQADLLLQAKKECQEYIRQVMLREQKSLSYKLQSNIT